MVTSKATSKKSVNKSASSKSTVAKKAPSKRPTSVRTSKATPASAWDIATNGEYKTFKVGKPRNFFSIRITDQTIYWAILCFIVLALGVWVITINDKVQRLYDQIDAQSAEDSLILSAKK